jgi:hypothetical protein
LCGVIKRRIFIWNKMDIWWMRGAKARAIFVCMESSAFGGSIAADGDV